MTHEEQRQRYYALVESGEHFREYEVRRIAALAATSSHRGPQHFRYTDPWGIDFGTEVDPVVRYYVIVVDLYPGLTGFARQLIAEEMVREQVDAIRREMHCDNAKAPPT